MCPKALHEVAAARRRTADAHTQGDRRGADACPRTCTRGLRPSSRARHPYSKPKSVHRGATADNVGAHVSFDRLDLGSARPCSAPTHLISFRPGPYFRNAPNLRFYRVEQRSDDVTSAGDSASEAHGHQGSRTVSAPPQRPPNSSRQRGTHPLAWHAGSGGGERRTHTRGRCET